MAAYTVMFKARMPPWCVALYAVKYTWSGEVAFFVGIINYGGEKLLQISQWTKTFGLFGCLHMDLHDKAISTVQSHWPKTQVGWRARLYWLRVNCFGSQMFFVFFSDISLYQYNNKKILSTTMFLEIKWSGYEWYMNKPLCKPVTFRI